MSKKSSFHVNLSVALVASGFITALLMTVIDSRLVDEESFVRGEHAKNIMLFALFLNWIIANIVAWWMEKKGV